MAKYRRTFTSGGKQISTENQVIDFYHEDMSPKWNINVQFLSFQTFGEPIRLKINNESTIHLIEANSEFIISDIDIDKITLLDGDVQFYYTAMTTD